MSVELKVPQVGESVTEVEIGEWVKQEGDQVKRDETVVMLDSAKATVELPSPIAGTVERIVKQTGETAAVGDVIAYLAEGADAAAGKEAPAGKAASKSGAKAAKNGAGDLASEEPTPQWEQSPNGGQEPNEAKAGTAADQAPSFVMPAAQRVLAQHDAPVPEGSGPGRRVLKEDAERAVATKAEGATTAPPPESAQVQQPQPGQSEAPKGSPAPPPATKKPAPQPQLPPVATAVTPGVDEEVVPMSMLRRHIAQRLVEAQQTAALLTTFNEIDMTEVMDLRKQHQDAFQKRYGIKLGFMSFFVKAVIDALKQCPALNAEIRDNNIVYKNHYDIGVAIGGGRGLVVPVLRHAERMSFAEIEMGIADYATRVKENKLSPDELLGGTFTITNGGIYGSMLSTPIVNPPQSGILGMHAIQERPVARNGEVVVRSMMYAALTYDHRIVDGREAVGFLVRIKECIENPSRMLIEV